MLCCDRPVGECNVQTSKYAAIIHTKPSNKSAISRDILNLLVILITLIIKSGLVIERDFSSFSYLGLIGSNPIGNETLRYAIHFR